MSKAGPYGRIKYKDHKQYFGWFDKRQTSQHTRWNHVNLNVNQKQDRGEGKAVEFLNYLIKFSRLCLQRWRWKLTAVSKLVRKHYLTENMGHSRFMSKTTTAIKMKRNNWISKWTAFKWLVRNGGNWYNWRREGLKQRETQRKAAQKRVGI